MTEPTSPSDSSATPDGAAIDLSRHFLIAMPTLQDDHFNGTVVYLAEHTPRGALGLIINRPLTLTMAEVFERISLGLEDPVLAQQQVLQGGPVQADRGFVLHMPKGDWTSTLSSPGGDIHLTSSKDILEACAQGRGPDKMLLALGCSSWAGGQLESEIARNAWLTVPARSQIVFDVPIKDRYQRAVDAIGFASDSFLSSDAGHA